MKRAFRVLVEVPTGVTNAVMAEYIREAVASMKGCKRSDDPLFELNGSSVRVARLGAAGGRND